MIKRTIVMMFSMEIEETIKKAVNAHYSCNGEYPCPKFKYCIFGSGKNTAYDSNECGADEFAEGYRTAVEVKK